MGVALYRGGCGMENFKVAQVSKAAAAQLMTAARLDDPARLSTPQSIADNGECFSLQTGGHCGVFVVRKKDRQLWVSGAAAIASKGLAAAGLDVMQAIAQQSECDTVGFQTGRKGLVRIAKKKGFEVVGFILEKRI